MRHLLLPNAISKKQNEKMLMAFGIYRVETKSLEGEICEGTA